MVRRRHLEVICASTPWPFFGVGLWYEDFSQATDGKVRELLTQFTESHAAGNDTET